MKIHKKITIKFQQDAQILWNHNSIHISISTLPSYS